MTAKKNEEEEGIMLEDIIMELARTGQLAGAGRQAIEETHRLGLPATLLIDDGIYKLYPDGSKELIKPFVRTKHHFTSTKIFIK